MEKHIRRSTLAGWMLGRSNGAAAAGASTFRAAGTVIGSAAGGAPAVRLGPDRVQLADRSGARASRSQGLTA